MEHEGDGDANCSWRTWNAHQRIGTRNWKCWKSEEELRPSKLHHRPGYREESWRPEETCCHPDSNEQPSADTGVKNLKRSEIIIIIIITSNRKDAAKEPEAQRNYYI